MLCLRCLRLAGSYLGLLSILATCLGFPEPVCLRICRRCSRSAGCDGNHVCRSFCPTTSSSDHRQQASQLWLIGTWVKQQKVLDPALLIPPTLPALAASSRKLPLPGSQGLHTALMLLSPSRPPRQCPARAQQQQGRLNLHFVGALLSSLPQHASSRCRLHPPAPCRGAIVRRLLTSAWQRTLLQHLPSSTHQQLPNSAYVQMSCPTRRPLRLQYSCWRTFVRMSSAR